MLECEGRWMSRGDWGERGVRVGGRKSRVDGWMDGGEWAEEVSEDIDADQQQARGGEEEVEGRRGLDPDQKVFWQAPPPQLASYRNCQN